MDLGLEKNGIIGKAKVSTALKIFNVYNSENILSRQYFINNIPTVSASSRDYLQINEITGSGFMYNLVLNFRF
jgi:hypothetical protein